MASFVSSNDNRFYVALETAYGQVSAVSTRSRIPAVKLTTRQQTERAQRRDKTGTRTYPGDPKGLRRLTSFGMKTYLTGWTDKTREPEYGPLFQACLGSPATIWPGGTILPMAPQSTRMTFTSPHGLAPFVAVSYRGEIRFVTNIVDSLTVLVNAPFLNAPTKQIPPTEKIYATANYMPANDLPSLSIFDYWSPASAVQRLLSGAAINEMKVNVNGDFHEFEFSGGAADLVDSASFEQGQAGLTQYPEEPPIQPLNYSIIPGHLGQVWLGSTPSNFCTLTKAQLTVTNDLDLRNHEFGCPLAKGVSPGIRTVSLDFSLFEKDTDETKALYTAARNRIPISVMLQLGQQTGEMFGIYVQNVVPEVPEFDDSERRLQWHFPNCRAEGGINDELFVAFG